LAPPPQTNPTPAAAADPTPARPAPAHVVKPPPERSSNSNKPLTSGEIQSTVDRYRDDIVRCLKDLDARSAPTDLKAHITIDMAGKVGGVEFVPSLERTSEQCLEHSLRAMRFRKHPMAALKVTIPLKIQVQ
jgi:hypothetical protein